MVRVLLCLSLLVLASPAAHAADTVFLEELTWTELRDQIRSGKTTIIVPIGGTEQNGPHMALGKHNLRVRVLSERIARALGDALVAPVIAYVPEGTIDPPTAHMKFPGTITVPEEAFTKVLEYAARSFKAAQFRHIMFLGDHGSYQKDEKSVADRLDKEWAATPVRVYAIEEYYRASENGFGQLLESKGYPKEEVGLHAGLADTSLTLAVDPRLVRTDRLQASTDHENGVNGNPRRSSVELGKLGVDLVVTQTVAAIKTAIGHR
jgi:creatinine amidohydrolase/Fe(II)-dependent formamide hydrolase-like protein